MNILIKFGHGLGDAVQLTTVLQHLRHKHPEWNVDVAALVGKDSTFQGICRRTFVLGRDVIPEADYDVVYDLEWLECHIVFADSPSTKAERSLREVFNFSPIPSLCTYCIQTTEATRQLARQYLGQVCHAAPGEDGRYPVVLIHYQGNTSGENKDLSVDVVRNLCDDILDERHVPVILDWDRRTPLADGLRIHNPHVHTELWKGTGTGDAQSLAALTELSTLMVGIDSGPLHVAGATSTPTIGVWTRHHPLHYFGLANNVTHLVPRGHAGLLRGNRDDGEAYFSTHYRHELYDDLERALRAATRARLQDPTGAMVFTRDFWVRTGTAEQDLVVVQDIVEEDSYQIDLFPMCRPTVVDVGAHIGCFSKRLHDRNPLARVFAIECCPENLPALRKNVEGIASVIQAAMTYETDVALLNAVYPGCNSTGGSTLVDRLDLERRVAENACAARPGKDMPSEYWADFRHVPTLTLEELMHDRGIGYIDILKLDCEGSEYSILGNTTSLDRIGMIVGEYHGKERFQKLIAERFSNWHLFIIRDGDIGTFWLMHPQHPARDVKPRESRSDQFRFGISENQRFLAQLRSTKFSAEYYLEHKAAGLDYLTYGQWQVEYGRWLVDSMEWNGKRVLDVGCACGGITRGLNEASALASGVDIDEYMVQLGRHKWQDLASNLFICDAANLHLFDDAAFDGIHSSQVAEHWKPCLVPMILAELARVTRRGGLWFCSLDTEELFTRQGRTIETDDPTHVCIRPMSWWHEQLALAGWELCGQPVEDRLRSHAQSFLQRYDWGWWVARRL